MAYLYLKAIHIIFVVTWFAGLFYMPRLFIYNVEANNRSAEIKNALHQQFGVMMKRLWYGITWPSAILTLIFGVVVLWKSGFWLVVFRPEGLWLLLKLILVVFLYGYHFTLGGIMKQQLKGDFKYSSDQLRMWNEVATIFLITIVILVIVKQSMSLAWGIAGTILLVGILMLAIRIYKKIRSSSGK